MFSQHSVGYGVEYENLTVLFLSASGQIGGAERVLLTLAAKLSGIHPALELNLITGGDGPLVQDAAALGMNVRVLPFGRYLRATADASRWNSASFVGRAWALGEALVYRRRLYHAIQQISPHVIHSNGMKMHLLASSLRRDLMRVQRDSFTLKQSNEPVWICHMHDYVRAGRFAQAVTRWFSGRFDCVVPPSASVAMDLSSAGVPAHKIRTIHNGVDPERFTPEGEASDLDRMCGLEAARGNVLRVGMVAAFACWKGHRTFLHALALLPPECKVRAYLIGGPIYEAAESQITLTALREAARRDCPRVKVGFAGWVEDVAGVYRSLDVVVHASTSPEPFGLVIVEAMLSGVPVIVSRQGGACELFEEGITALSHASGDAQDLAAQIARLARDPELRLRLQANARLMAAEQFSARTMGNRFAELYCDLSEQRRSLCSS